MACYHPLKAWPIGVTSAGKTDYKITDFMIDHVEVVGDSVWPILDKDVGSLARKVIRDYIEIPCGNCIGCRLAYSRAWADRCMLELKDHESSFFVTLTYDEAHVPRSWYSDPNTGEAFQALSLRKRDLQLFHKRLRKALDYKVRMFSCGEYGDLSLRPHYHDIIFGLKLYDLKFYSRSSLGYVYYNSDFLQSVWSDKEGNPIGHVVVGEVNWDTCAYTARYVMKKLKGEASQFYVDHNIEPPFVLMSRKPGIGRKYYDDHPDLFDRPCIYLVTDDGSHPVYPPRYYKKLFEIDDPEAYETIRERNREIAMVKAQNLQKRTDLDYLSQLAVEENVLQQKIKGLPRKEF